jgi:hypothetical protein
MKFWTRLALGFLTLCLSAQATHVKSYTRKDGAQVQGYERSSGHKSATSKPKPAPKRAYCASCERGARGRIERSAGAKRAFVRIPGHVNNDSGRM